MSTIDSLKKLGKYEIQKKIGAGGMGTVFLAIDTGLRRSVALKVLPHEKAGNPTLVKRFKSEAQAAANLRHENIVMVYEAGEADGLLYIALEYVEGTDVANIVQKRGVMPVKRSLEVVRQVALALQHAHAQGIVHRDIKPANILIRRDGTAKLADLGLARAVDDHTDTSITRAGTTVGTVDYMSPEQARDSKSADVRSDLYSLGCTWYFMLTGEPPFPDGSMTNKLRSHAEAPIPDPRALNPSVTEAVYAVIRRMTEKEPSRRYQTPAELISDLETARVANDIVAEAILGESDDDQVPPVAARRPAGKRARIAEGDERPRRRPAVVADEEGSIPAWKPPRQDRERQRQPTEWGRAVAFYAVVVLLIGGVLVGLGWLVQRIGSSVDAPGKEVAGNLFVNGEGAEQPPVAVNPLQGDGTIVRGPGPAADDRTRSVNGSSTRAGQSVEGDGSGTRIGPGSDQPLIRVIDGNDPAQRGPKNVGSSTDLSATSPSGAVAGSNVSGRRGGTALTGAAADRRLAKEEALLPSWSASTNAPGETMELPRLYVRRGASEDGRLPSLNAALEQTPTGGAIIVLEGRGPFPLLPARIAGKRRIVIQSDNSVEAREAPLVVLLPGDAPASGGWLEFVDTAVELQHIHLACSAAVSGIAGALFHMQGSDLTLRNCSLTVTAPNPPPLTAIRLSRPPAAPTGGAAAPMRVLLDRTIVRGHNLTSIVVDAPELELVVRRSLLWSGKAPALRLSGTAGTSANPRTVRLASATVCSSACAVEVAGDPERPVATALEWIHSLVAVPDGAASPVLCVLDGWNADRQQQALGKTLTWKSVDSLYLGWKALLRREPEGISAAADIGDWIRAWKDQSAAGPGQIQEIGWPSGASNDFVRAPSLDRLAPESVGKHFVKTVDGGWPGCPVDLLAVPGLKALEVPAGAADRPQIPVGLIGGPSTAEVIRIDLTKEDLGRALSDRKPPHGAQIVATGYGARQSSPIVIQNAWVRLKFEQTDGPPLVLTPRGESARSGEGNPGGGFIVVNNGGLEITGGAFTVAVDRPQLPRWFIQVIDGDLALRHCRIQGGLAANVRTKGLVQWLRTSGRPPPRFFAGSLDGYAVFENCCLIGSGTLIEADLLRRGMFFRNCVLAARDDLLSIHLRGVQREIAGAVDFETTTLSAAGSFLKVAAAATDAPTNGSLSIYADRCVFGPSLPSGASKAEATLLSFSGPLIEQRQLNWSENRCGYAPDVVAFLREETAPVAAQDFEGVWLGQWGAAQVIEPLTGPQGVVLNKSLPQRPEDRAKLEPNDFSLLPSSRAATWDDNHGPIGAPLGELSFPPIRAAPVSAPAKSKTGKPAKPAPSRPTKPMF